MRVLYRVVWIVSLLAILGMSCLFAMQPPSLPTIAPMTAYVSDDKSLALPYPGNWKPRESSAQAVSFHVAFDPNPYTHFAVDMDLAGSLMGDIARSNTSMLASIPGMPAGAVEAQKSPLELLHEASLHGMAKNKKRFAEFARGATQPTQIGGIDALATEFTFKQGAAWSRKEMTGTYVTLLTKDREVRVIATCSQELQKTLKPVFDQMIAGMHLGQPGG